jgi:hypothetical protein
VACRGHRRHMDGSMISEKKRRALAAYASGGGGFIFVSPSIGAAWTLASLGIADSGLGTYIVRGTITVTGTGTAQQIIGIDSNATANAYFLRQNATGNGGAVVRTTSSASSATTTGTFVVGEEFRFGMAVDGVGGAIASFNGNATFSVSGGPTAGLLSLRVGQNAIAALTFSGTIARVRVLPGIALASADLRAAVAAL